MGARNLAWPPFIHRLDVQCSTFDPLGGEFAPFFLFLLSLTVGGFPPWSVRLRHPVVFSFFFSLSILFQYLN